MLIIAVLISTVGIAKAATETQKQAAIASGLAWLAAQQYGDGSFAAYSGYPIASTASALLSFEEQYYKQGNSWGSLNGGLGYGTVVTNAANYLPNNVSTASLAPANWWGFTGTYGDKTGAYWGYGEEAYQTGLALSAIARLTSGINGITPGTPVTTGPLSGQTYLNVIQRAVDQITWSQTGPDYAPYNGGWHYLINAPQLDADNSTAQWPVIGLTFAKPVPGVTVYSQTATELKKWVSYIQNTTINDGTLGSSGYMAPVGSYNNEAKTGGLLVEMQYAGGGGNQALALAYLNANWTNGASTWFGNFDQPYAMWSIYKGLQETIGLGDTTTITNLHSPAGIMDPGDTWNWWEDYCNSLVISQNGDGSWPGYWWYWGSDLSTAWNINILNATAVPPPHGTPEPATLSLLVAGLLGAGIVRRKVKG